MATDDPNSTHESRKLRAHEVSLLADRIFARAVSVLFDVRPELRKDMLLASACLRVLASTNPDGVTVDVWVG
jgi:hypothetical protein